MPTRRSFWSSVPTPDNRPTVIKSVSTDTGKAPAQVTAEESPVVPADDGQPDKRRPAVWPPKQSEPTKAKVFVKSESWTSKPNSIVD